MSHAGWRKIPFRQPPFQGDRPGLLPQSVGLGMLEYFLGIEDAERAVKLNLGDIFIHGVARHARYFVPGHSHGHEVHDGQAAFGAYAAVAGRVFTFPATSQQGHGLIPLRDESGFFRTILPHAVRDGFLAVGA